MDFAFVMGPNDLALVRLYREIVEDGEVWKVEFKGTRALPPREVFRTLLTGIGVCEAQAAQGQPPTTVTFPKLLED